MEQGTKTILWILAFITLPITIPLTIISIGIAITIILCMLTLFLLYIDEVLIMAILVIVCYVVYKWLSRNG